MASAFHTLIHAGATINLSPSLHTSQVYGTPGIIAFSAARAVAQTLNIPHAEQGFIAAGTPIGPPTLPHNMSRHRSTTLSPSSPNSCPLPRSQCKRSSSSYPVPSNAASHISPASTAQKPSEYHYQSFKPLWRMLLSAYSQSHKTPMLLLRWASHTLLFASNCAYPSEKVV